MPATAAPSAKPSTFQKALLSGVDQAAGTPLTLLRVLLQAFYPARSRSSVFDPSPPQPAFDGLAVRWARHNFCNPPFDSVERWYAKALQEAANGAHSVLLVPYRGHTRYFHRLIAHTATSVTVFTNRVTFLPYRAPFALPVMALEVGPGSQGPRASSELQVVRVPLRLLSYERPGFYPQGLVADLEAAYGSFDAQLHCRLGVRLTAPGLLRALRGSRNAFVCVMYSPRLAIEAVAQHVRSTGATACVMVLPQFNAAYFRAALPLVRGVALVSPSIAFGAGRSYMGSVVLRFGGRARRTGLTLGFATWRGGAALRDP